MPDEPWTTEPGVPRRAIGEHEHPHPYHTLAIRSARQRSEMAPQTDPSATDTDTRNHPAGQTMPHGRHEAVIGGHDPTEQVSVGLLDGRTVVLRRLGHQDADAVLALHQRLPDQDRYFRFFTVRPSHLDQFAAQLTERDDGCFALGAFDADRLTGVANYVIDEHHPSVAEVAIAVAHCDHQAGVGTALTTRLVEIALAHGIRCFTADVLATNHLMLQVLGDAGWPYTKLSDDGQVMRFQIQLPARWTDAAQPRPPDTATHQRR